MLRQWILNLVFKIRHIPGVKNFADILTKALALEPFSRFRDAALNAKIVFPSLVQHSRTMRTGLHQWIYHCETGGHWGSISI